MFTESLAKSNTDNVLACNLPWYLTGYLLEKQGLTSPYYIN